MNESLKKVLRDSIESAIKSTATEIAELCDAVLEPETKKGLIHVLDEMKSRINVDQEKKKAP